MTPDPVGKLNSRFRASYQLRDRAQRVMAGGVSTAFRSQERPVPLVIDRASGAHLIDVDGREYIDFVCGFGPVILGHGHARVCRAAETAARMVQQVGGQHLTEIELAEGLCSVVPSFELIRLAGSGSEAVHAAVRTTRAFTERRYVVKFAGHYHGWFDGIFTGEAQTGVATPATQGQPTSALADLLVAQWNDEAGLHAVFDRYAGQIAAVIMEPIACNGGLIYPARGWLKVARELTADHQALLIFDEVITGFRVGLGGVQGLTGITPDITIVGKAMANGFPIAAFGGRRDVMQVVGENAVIHAGTYNGGGASTAAALATLGELRADTDIYSRLTRLGQRLITGLAERARDAGENMVVQGPGPVFFASFVEPDVREIRSFEEQTRSDSARYSRFAALLLERGVRVIPAGRWYLSGAHTDADVDATLEAVSEAFNALI